jgi:hypothetical protein
VIGLFHFDHIALHAFETPDRDEWHNLTPLLAAAHLEKTRRDLKIIAKVRRIRATLPPQNTAEDLVDVIIRSQKPWTKRKIAKRINPWPPRGSRKLRSRPRAKS